MDDIGQLLKIIGILIALVTGLLTALWAYTKYVLERGFLPPVRFYVTGEKLGMVDKQNILDIKIHLKNVGSTTLIARNIRLDLRYIRNEEKDLDLFKDRRRAGRLKFPNPLIKDEKIDASNLIPIKIRHDKEQFDLWNKKKHRGFLVSEHDTFVQAGVDQVYTFVTMVPKDTLCFLTWCSFQYAQNLSNWQNRVSIISRKLGLIQFTLKHAQIPHTVENVFWIEDNAHRDGEEPTSTSDKATSASGKKKSSDSK